MKNKTAKLFFCHESEDAVNVRETTLSPSAYGDNTNKSKELYSRKIVEFNEMRSNLLGFIGNKVSGNVFFPEIKKPLSLYIIIVGKTFYFTSVLQKRGQMTYTFQLNHTDCCCDLLDYMKDGMAEDKEKDAFFEETELIRQELKETGDSNNVYS